MRKSTLGRSAAAAVAATNSMTTNSPTTRCKTESMATTPRGLVRSPGILGCGRASCYVLRLGDSETGRLGDGERDDAFGPPSLLVSASDHNVYTAPADAARFDSATPRSRVF